MTLVGVEARAAPPDPTPTDAAPEDRAGPEQRVEQAIEAWQSGEWTEVRDLLEPLVRDGEGISDPLLRESALRYLAEATLLDEGLDPVEREDLARGYITRLLESETNWTPPTGLHGRAFYDLVAAVRAERDAALAEACAGQLLTCEADLTELQVDYRAAIDDMAKLRTAYESKEIQVTEVRQRNRGLALLPFGIGHFTNGNNVLGGTFLGVEVASGIAGLSLLLYRSTALGCVRTAGFAPGSLECTVEGTQEEDLPQLRKHTKTIRDAESVMGYVFIGSMIVDVIVAQILFRRFEVVDRGTKTKGELDEELEQLDTPGGPGGRPRRRQPSAEDGDAKLRIRPTPALVPGGAGLGVTVQF